MIGGNDNSSAQAVRQVSGKPSIKQRIVAGAKKFYIIVGYLWVVLSLLELHRLAIFRELNRTDRIDYRIALALINALVLGKVVLVADELHLAEPFLRDKRLIFSVLFRSAVLAVLLLLFDVVEAVIVGMLHGKTLIQSIPQMGGGGLEGKLIVGTIMFFFGIPFFAFTETRQVMGKDEMRSLMLAKRSGR